ncbi:MAG: shikimate dehydrogenase [Planctomycetota bacterium]|jgi:3-dehydroquinate dehydratase/shikimate dehydrogenase
METRLVVPIAARNLEGAGQQIRAAAAAGAEMLELRTDYLESLSTLLVEKLIFEAKSGSGQSGLPIVVTCRDKREGGVIAWPRELRLDVLTSALAVGAEFVDFEYEDFLPAESREKILRALSQNPKARLILSAHSFEGKFGNISKVYRDILAVYPAAIPKLVYGANHINDCFEAFDLLHGTGGERIVFCMGGAGLMSRILAKKLGSFVTFASIDEESATAPGQLTIGQFKRLYRYDSIDDRSELYGVIGQPVAHSLSPAIHNACFDDIGASKLYLPLLVEGGKGEFESFMGNVLRRKWLGFRGFSVTIPHKQNALDYVVTNRGFIEPLAKRIGAVNTLHIDGDGRLSAYNTDYAGALNAITSALGIGRRELREMSVAVIGAGGVARGIVAGLSDVGAKIRIYNRTVKRGEQLAAEFDCSFAPLDELPNVDAKLVINCTSIGMHPNIDETPLGKECIKKNMVVFDTVYNPAETLLLRQAEEAGAKTIDGLSMFINQACAQFRLFTGESADRELMRKTILDCLC